MRTERPGRPGERTDRRPPRKDERQKRGTPDRSPSPLLYGRNGVVEALRGRRAPRRLYVAYGIKEDARIKEALALATARAIPVERKARLDLDEMLGPVNHQGIALSASDYPYASIDDILQRAGTVLVLDHLQDTQNLGTLLRAAEAAAVAGVVIARDRAAEVTPAVVNASAGAVEHLHIAQEVNLARVCEIAKKSGRWVIGLDGGAGSIDLYDGALPTPAVLVVGSEGDGVTPIVRKACDLIVRIPMAGAVGSLNASTAGAIALFELVRRERQQG